MDEKTKRLRQILATFWGGWVARGPRKPAHVDHFREARIARNKHIKPNGARRTSFRRYWRANQNHVALRGWDREHKRAQVKEWWKSDGKS